VEGSVAVTQENAPAACHQVELAISVEITDCQEKTVLDVVVLGGPEGAVAIAQQDAYSGA